MPAVNSRDTEVTEKGNLGIGIWDCGFRDGEGRAVVAADPHRPNAIAQGGWEYGRHSIWELGFGIADFETARDEPSNRHSVPIPSFPRRRESRPPKAVMRPTHLIPYSLSHGTARCEPPRRKGRREKTLRDGGLLGPRPRGACGTLRSATPRQAVQRAVGFPLKTLPASPGLGRSALRAPRP